MPSVAAVTPRKMLPPPMTMAISTPVRCTWTISSAMLASVSASMPVRRPPISASPESFRRTRPYLGPAIRLAFIVAPMEYVNLGSTGLKVSRLCLGTMTYGTSQWRPWILDEDASRPFLREALESGINFFDTANMYSNGASEEVVGRALRDFARRDEVVIATKVFFPTGKGPNDRGL